MSQILQVIPLLQKFSGHDEELFQTACLTFLEQESKYNQSRGALTTFAWMCFRRARNTMYSDTNRVHKDTQNIYFVSLEDDEALAAEEWEATSELDKIEQSLLHSDLEAVISARLTKNQQEVIRLYFFEHKTIKEIAEIQGKKHHQCVFNALQRGLQRLSHSRKLADWR